MRIYLDACSINRPFDDQLQGRIRLESEAVMLFIQMVRTGRHEWVSSEVLEDELARIKEEERRVAALGLLGYTSQRVQLDEEILELGRQYVIKGLSAMDALPVAVAEMSGCGILLPTDDSLQRKVARFQPPLRVRVVNPAKWVAEVLEP